MILAVVLLGIFQVGIGIFAYKLILNKVETGVNHQKQAIFAELDKLIKNEPCQSATLLNIIGHVVGSSAGKSLRASLMQSLGAASNTLNGIGYDEAVDKIGEGQPAIGGLLAGLGRQKGSKLLNNPLLQLAFSAIANKGDGSQANNQYQRRRHRE
jgi:hypothetical protein